MMSLEGSGARGIVGGGKGGKVNSKKGWKGVYLKSCGHSGMNVEVV